MGIVGKDLRIEVIWHILQISSIRVRRSGNSNYVRCRCEKEFQPRIEFTETSSLGADPDIINL